MTKTGGGFYQSLRWALIIIVKLPALKGRACRNGLYFIDFGST